ncbi:IclR family transcriptional regulator [Georgenia alba]|uniref:IclR family transcriptional regulator n=1 Tax=Georgenia alba TaxID=2233858 RepID=A0ABW2Q7M8_9MICO
MTTSHPGGARSSIQVIDRSMALLRRIADGGPSGQSLGSLAQDVGLPASTARTLLSALVTHGLVRQTEPGRRYLLGPSFFELNRAYVDQSDLASVAAPLLHELWLATDETVHLSVLKDAQRVDISVLVSQQLLNVNPTRSHDLPAPPFRTAAGKVLFAGLDPDERRALVSSAPWRSTVTEDVAALEKLAKRIEHDGFATNFEEEAPGVCGVAAPVRDHSDRVVAAVCVGYPAVRRTPEHDETLRAAVVACASHLSALLGGRTDRR